MLGEFLEKNAPDVTVKVIIKSQEDWGDFLDTVSFRCFDLNLNFRGVL